MGVSPEKASLPSIPEVVRRLGWVSLFQDAAGDMVYPLLAPFLRSMGAGGAALGALEAVSEGVSAVVKWRSGAWADRGDRKRLVVIGYAIASVARPIIGFAVAPWQVIALRSTDRIGKGVRSAPRDAMLAGAVDPAHRARAFGFHKMMDNAGAVLGPLMAFALARFLSWTPRDIIKFSIVPGALAVLMLIFGVKDTAAPAKAYGLEERPLFERGRQTKVSAAKAALIYVGVELLGKTLKEMAEHTHMSTPAASKA